MSAQAAAKPDYYISARRCRLCKCAFSRIGIVAGPTRAVDDVMRRNRAQTLAEDAQTIETNARASLRTAADMRLVAEAMLANDERP